MRFTYCHMSQEYRLGKVESISLPLSKIRSRWVVVHIAVFILDACYQYRCRAYCYTHRHHYRSVTQRQAGHSALPGRPDGDLGPEHRQITWSSPRRTRAAGAGCAALIKQLGRGTGWMCPSEVGTYVFSSYLDRYLMLQFFVLSLLRFRFHFTSNTPFCVIRRPIGKTSPANLHIGGASVACSGITISLSA